MLSDEVRSAAEKVKKAIDEDPELYAALVTCIYSVFKEEAKIKTVLGFTKDTARRVADRIIGREEETE